MPNVPNSITLFRILLVPLLMVFMLVAIPGGDIFALIIFVAAAASDSIDGYVARRTKQTTVMGAFLDPLADKLLVVAAMVSLVSLNRLSAWIAMVVVAREFAVSGLRMVAAAQGVVISASKWGKAKTASQVLAIAVLLIEPRWLKPTSWTPGGHKLSWFLVVIMLVLTVLSGADYFWKSRSQLVETSLAKAPKDDQGGSGD